VTPPLSLHSSLSLTHSLPLSLPLSLSLYLTLWPGQGDAVAEQRRQQPCRTDQIKRVLRRARPGAARGLDDERRARHGPGRVGGERFRCAM